MTKFFLASSANFSSEDRSFELARNPFEGERIHPGPYRLGKRVEDVNTYRIGHPLAQRILTSCKTLPSEPGEILFDYSGSKRKITSLAILRGKAGWLTCVRVGITAFETEDHLLFAGEKDIVLFRMSNATPAKVEVRLISRSEVAQIVIE